MKPNIQVQQMSKLAKRTLRKPRGNTFTRLSPFAITPSFFHPVLPHETVQKIMYRSTVRTPLLAGQFQGSRLYNYFYFVPITRLSVFDGANGIRQMLLDPDTDVSGIKTTAHDASYFSAKGSIDYLKECMKVIMEDHFRYEGEAWDHALIGDYPAIRLDSESVFHSLIKASEYDAGVDLNLDLDNDGSITMKELNAAKIAWAHQVSSGVHEMQFEDWLTTFGVRNAKEPNEDEIEHIQTNRMWATPSRLIDPTDGGVSSVCQWDVDINIKDRKKYFKVPGFLVGMQCWVPKYYFSNQTGSVAGFMNSHEAFFSPLTSHVEHSGYEEYPLVAGGTGNGTAEGPLSSSTTEYMLDLKDLLMYGENFFNATPEFTLPRPKIDSLDTAYPTKAEGDAYILSTVVDKTAVSDGKYQLEIKSNLTDDSQAVKQV